MKKTFLSAVVFSVVGTTVALAQNSFPSTGKVGIGTNTPTENLDIKAQAVNGSETFINFKVSDAPNDYMRIMNSTGNTGQLIPYISGHHVSDNRAALSFGGTIGASNDVGNEPIITFNASQSSGLAKTRPLFAWDNYSQRRMILSASGNLGIGTTNPKANLQVGEGTVNGQINLGGYSTIGSLRSGGSLFLGKNVFAEYNSSSDDNSFKVLGSNFSGFSAMEFNTDEVNIYATNKTLAENTKVNTPDYNIFKLKSNSDGPTQLILKGTQGGYSAASLVLKITHEANYRGAGVFMHDKGGQNEWFAGRPYGSAIGSDQYVIFRKSGLADHEEEVSALFRGDGVTKTGTEAMFAINSAGKVRIGTMNAPSTVGNANISAYKLFVKGGILSDEVRVWNNWADYVFADNYELKPLSEVETFIKENNHLPNVPSAKQIEEEGLNLGDITRIQQEKIEELTLYIIQLSKEVEALKNQIKTN